MKNKFLFLTFTVFITVIATAQTSTTWNGKKCAVVLTYDDGLKADLTTVIPAWDSLGLKGAFYISDYFYGLKDQIPRWRTASAKGHELANHTVHHPCLGNLPGRSFVKLGYDMNNYTIRRITDVIKTMNNILKAIDGKTRRTFAYPCGDTKIHDPSYIDGMKNDFVAARGVQSEMLSINKINLYNIGSYAINGQSGDQLIDLVKKAADSHTLLVFPFHGVGGEHSLNVDKAAHSELLHYLKQN